MCRTIRLFICVCVCHLALQGFAAEADLQMGASMMRLPPMKMPPNIDGKIDADEWKGAGVSFGSLKAASATLEPRKTLFRLGYDSKAVYFSCSSELPPGELKLLSRVNKPDVKLFMDDLVEILLCPPGGDFAYQLAVNSTGTAFKLKYPMKNGALSGSSQAWDTNIKTASSFDNGNWNFEVAISYSEMKFSPLNILGEWRVQMCRDWTQPQVQTCWSKSASFSNPDQMGKVIFDKSTPIVVEFNTLGPDYASGDMDCRLGIVNTGDKSEKLKVKIDIVSGGAPLTLDEEKVIPPGTTETVALARKEISPIPRDCLISVSDSKTGVSYFSKYFSWEPNTKSIWSGGGGNPAMDFAYLPTFHTLKCRIDPASMKDGKSIKEVRFQVKSKIDKAVVGDRSTAVRSGSYFRSTMNLPELSDGDYEIEAELIMKNGDKPIIISREFSVKKFPWENSALGLEDVIVPPFIPLKVSDDSRRVDALMTAYSMKNGFWDAIYAQGENILARPVSLVIDSGKVKFTEKSFQSLSRTNSSVICETVSESPGGVKMSAKYEYDYDGMCKLTIELIPEKPVLIENGFIEVPLKSAYANLFHTTNNNMRFNPADYIPKGNGVVWDSTKAKLNNQLSGNFRPYFWFGDIYKGLCWFSESDKNWSVDPAKPALELIRNDAETSLRVNLFSQPFTLNSPRKFVIGFQATPVKPQMQNWRRMFIGWKPDGVKDVYKIGCFLSTTFMGGDGDFWPAGKDYSLLEKFTTNRHFRERISPEVINAYVEKYYGDRSNDRKNYFRKGLTAGEQLSYKADFIFEYLNPKISKINWPEYQIFMDEWWCSEYRANNADPYNTRPEKSYQDFMLSYARKLIDCGFDGIYYDNVRDWPVFSDVTGPGYVRPDGEMQPYFDIFAMRQTIKRTATLLFTQNKKFLDDRPFLYLHMTNTNIIPLMSFGTVSLEWEANYGSSDFQTRFPDGYILATTIGTQSGCVPSVLIEITGNEKERVSRTFIATVLAYDIPLVYSQGGLDAKALRTTFEKLYKFGYGLPDVESFPCWKNQKYVLINGAGIKMAVHRRNDGNAIIAVSDFSGKDNSCEIDFAGLGLGPLKVSNMETNTTLILQGTKAELKIPKYEFVLLLAEKIKK